LDLETVALGLFGGAGATLLWEALLQPTLARRALAEVLAAEVSVNLQLLGAAASLASSKKLPPDFSSSTQVFESLVARVGELPPRLVAEIVFLYRYFFELNEHPKAYVECVRELRGYEPGSPNYKACERELLSQVAVFNQYVTKATARIALIQPLLLKAAFPWWSLPRKWRRPVEMELNLSELQQNIVRSQRERDELAREVAQRSEAHGGPGDAG
jgi:hypothetical protein